MTLQEIHDRLEQVPALKARESERYARLNCELEKMKLAFNRDRGKKLLQFKVTYPDALVNEIKARLEVDEELYYIQSAILDKECELKIIETNMQFHDDVFTGAKMEGRLLMTEIGGGLSHVRDERGM